MQYIRRTFVAVVVVAIAALAAPLRAIAQTGKPEPTNFSTWLRGEIQKILTDERAIAANGNGVANQKESPSTDETSTSLVDTSSASDFISFALNLTGLRADEGDDSTPTSGSVTATLYSLIAGIKGVSMTDPQFYKRGTPWRRLSLTIGSEESKPAEHFTDKPSTNLGAKLLLLNNRDIYSAHAQRQLASMDLGVDVFVEKQQDAINEIQCLVFRAVDKSPPAARPCTAEDPAWTAFLLGSPFGADSWPKNLAILQKDKAAMEHVTNVLQGLAAGHRSATEMVAAAVEQIQKGLQLSVAYYSKQREDMGTDEHRAELIFDYGLSTRLNWTANASFDFSDRKQVEDKKAGRFATEFQAKLSNPGTGVWSARPVILSGSIQGSKASESDWLIRAQVKVVVPITTGIDIPIAYAYANRDDDGIVSGSQLKFSLAVDPVRLRERFR